MKKTPRKLIYDDGYSTEDFNLDGDQDNCILDLLSELGYFGHYDISRLENKDITMLIDFMKRSLLETGKLAEYFLKEFYDFKVKSNG